MTTYGIFGAWSGSGLNDRWQYAPNVVPTALVHPDSNVLSLETVEQPGFFVGSNCQRPSAWRATLRRL